MEISTQRRCLTMLAGGLLSGGVCAVVWSLAPIKTEAPGPATSGQMTSQADAITDPRGTDTALNDLALRRPLLDAAPVPTPPVIPDSKVPTVQKPRLELTLVGTMIDAGKSLAIIADPSGKFDVKGVGESLELLPAGVTVQSIESEEVVLQYRGKDSTVALDKKANANAGRPKPKDRRRNK